MDQDLVTAIEEIRTRLETAQRAYHNSQDWFEEIEPYTGITYAERIDQAINKAKELAEAA